MRASFLILGLVSGASAFGALPIDPVESPSRAPACADLCEPLRIAHPDLFDALCFIDSTASCDWPALKSKVKAHPAWERRAAKRVAYDCLPA